MTSRARQMGRLAFREEGKNWVCYFAMADTMEGAITLGSIAMRLVENPERRNAFMALMRECFSDISEELFGARPLWPDPGGKPAPESERSGNA